MPPNNTSNNTSNDTPNHTSSQTARPKTPIRTRIRENFRVWGEMCTRYRWPIVGLCLLLTLGLASALPRIVFENNTSEYLREDDPEYIRYNEFRAQFGLDDHIMIAIQPPEIFDLAFLEKLRAFHEALENELPHVAEVTSLINARETRGEGDTLIVEDLLEKWPTSDADLAALRAKVFANPLYVDQLISHDGSITTVIIRPATYSSVGAEEGALDSFDDNSTVNAADAAFLSSGEKREIVKALDALLPRFQSEDFRTYVAAGAVTGARITDMLMREVKKYSLFSTLAIAAILIFLFRRVWGLILPFVVVACSITSTLGIMVLLGIPFSMSLQMVPLFVMCVGVCASVHVLVLVFQKLDQGVPKPEAITYAFHHAGLAISMTSLTTVAGMASFLTAEIRPLQQLGIVAPIGVIMAFIFTMSLLPALIAILPIRARTHRSSSDPSSVPPGLLARGLIATGGGAAAHPWITLGLALVICGLSWIGISKIYFAQDPMRWFPKDHEIRVATDLLDEKIRGTATIEVIVDTGKENGLHDPSVLGRMEEAMRWAKGVVQKPLFVGKSVAVTDIVKETNQALHGNDPSYYAIPQTRDLIAQELLLFENSGSDDLEQFVDSQFRFGRITLRIPFADGMLYPPFLTELREGFTKIFGPGLPFAMTGIAPLSARINVTMVTSMAYSYLVALALITPMMIFLVGNWRLGLISMLPNLFPIAVVLGVMGWLDIPLDPSNIIIGSVLIGLAVDDTIHFMQTFQQYHLETGDTVLSVRNTLTTTGSAMLFTSIVLTTGFAIMGAVATMHNTIDFGFLTAFGITTAFLADIIIAPALMAVFVPNEVRAAKPARGPLRQTLATQRVLVTGAFGNIGRHTVGALLEEGYAVSCFDAPTPANKRTARRFANTCTLHWGDIRKPEDLPPALRNVDTVVHLAGIIPPRSELAPELAQSVNVEGTRNVIHAMQSQGSCKRLIFSSSIAVHGNQQDREPPLRVCAPYAPFDHYSRHKVECEHAILGSGLDWTILRLAACPTIDGSGSIDSAATMFEMGANARIEFCHPADVGLAIANAVGQKETIGKIFFIGGGERCQMRGYEFVSRCLDTMGLGPLPESAFNPSREFYGDWVDTAESQAMLTYQRHQFEHSLAELRKDLGPKRFLAKLFAPAIRRQLLRHSPYYSASRDR